eukprot:15483271-Alexandrium_andersonii.AAC.1
MCIRDRASGGLRPPGTPPEKRLRRARRPISSAESPSGRDTAQNPPLQSSGDQFRGCSCARSVP